MRTGSAAVAVIAIGAMAGCGADGQSPSPTPTTSAAVPEPQATAQAVASSQEGVASPGCVTSVVTIESDDLTLVDVGRELFGRLDCRSATPLVAQLAYLPGLPDIQERARAANATLTSTAGGDSATVRVITDSGTCLVSASDKPKSTMLTCG